jgi:hypothetical protein
MVFLVEPRADPRLDTFRPAGDGRPKLKAERGRMFR